MFTSDEHTVSLLKTALAHLCAAVFCAFFGAVYEHFSHEVYSYWMLYAFALPMVLGALPLLAIALHGRTLPGRVSLWLWNAGIAVLTVGCIFRGVLEIYGTTNRLWAVYPIVGGVLLATGLASYLLLGRKRRAAQQANILPAA